MANSSKTTNSSGAKSMAELMASHTSAFNVFKKGQEVEGVVKKLTPSEILLEIGAKSDALVLEVDKTNQDNLMRALKVGDKVKAVIISPESEGGFPVVSLRRALDNLMYADLNKFSSSQEDIEVTVVEPTRGGYFVASETGMRGFLPTSQVITQESLTGKKILVKIIEVDRAKKRVIFSEKATAYITDPETLRKMLPKGTVVKVKIQQIAPYGLFVSLPSKEEKSIDGFVHISEISYERVDNLPSLYKNGDTIEAAVLDVDTENRRVNLSVKATLKDTFTSASEKYKKEDKVKGAVTRVSTRGVTIDLGNGVNGFIQADKIPADTTYKTGDSVSAEVTDIDTRKRVVLLSPIITKAFVGYR